MVLDVNEILTEAMELGASDLHMTVGVPPIVRINGALQRLDYPRLTPDDTKEIIYGILTQRQREKFEEEMELDFSYSVPGKARFRTNAYFQRNSIGAAFRLIPARIRTLKELGLPLILGTFAERPRGFILITGPTGSGKSTTLASIIDIVNSARQEHIITIEDPIEFLHRHKRCMVNQREVGSDTKSFSEALKHSLREDPDVILVGEMRDLETISTALTAAETGHLVFSTLHTQDTPQTIDRIIDVFPPSQQQQVRIQLAGTLQGIVTQQLLPKKDGTGRVVACEILVTTPAVRNLIREAKVHQIYSVIQTGGEYGMKTMDQALAELYKAGKITYETALSRAASEEELRRLIGRM